MSFAAVPNVRRDPFPGVKIIGRFASVSSPVACNLWPQTFTSLSESHLNYTDQTSLKRSEDFFSTFLQIRLLLKGELCEKLEI